MPPSIVRARLTEEAQSGAPAAPKRLKQEPLRSATAGTAGGRGRLSEETARGLGPTYYATHLLDERPQVRSHIEPRFPDAVLLSDGRVVIELYINEGGTVDEVAVTEAHPPGFFESAAVEAFSAAQFRPGYLAGVAVKSRMVIEVLFGLNGGGHE